MESDFYQSILLIKLKKSIQSTNILCLLSLHKAMTWFITPFVNSLFGLWFCSSFVECELFRSLCVIRWMKYSYFQKMLQIFFSFYGCHLIFKMKTTLTESTQVKWWEPPGNCCKCKISCACAFLIMICLTFVLNMRNLLYRISTVTCSVRNKTSHWETFTLWKNDVKFVE